MSCIIRKNKDGSHTYEHNSEFICDSGKKLDNFFISFETHGNANNPVVIVNHALSSSYHIKATDLNPLKGWWENNVGPDKCLDTNKYYIISIGNLGSSKKCSNAENHGNFPDITINDIAKTQLILLNELEINKIRAVIGNSMGAYLSLTLATHLGNKLENHINISSSLKSYSLNKIIHRIQNEIITLNPDWEHQKNSPELLIARKIALLSYFNANYINNRFKDISELDSYLNYNSNKINEMTSPKVYLSNLKTMAEFNIENYFGSYKDAFARIGAKCLIVGVESDTLTPIAQQQELHTELKNANVDTSFVLSPSDKGHDAFYTDECISECIKRQLQL